MSAFFTHEPKLAPLLDEWVAHSPDSFAAHAARANHRFQLGQRGNKVSPAVLDQAKADFEDALARRPKYAAARRRLVQIAHIRSGVVRAREELDRATRDCPGCYIARSFHLDRLRPVAGGSHEQMIAFTNEVMALAEQNPKLGLLAGFVDWDRCQQALVDEQPELAQPACDAALSHGDEPRFLVSAARVQIELEDAEAALPLLDRALAVLPLEEDALELRYWVRIELGDTLGAGRDLLALQHLDPLAPEVPDWIEHMVQKLRFEGQELGKAGKHVEAAEYFALGLKLAPSDEDLMQREAFNQKSIGFDDAKRQLAAAPNDFALHLRIDHGLAASGRFADVVTLWDVFIAAHPEDPRPYVERGGAKWHLRQREAAIQDMAQACHYGLESACADVLNMRKRLRR